MRTVSSKEVAEALGERSDNFLRKLRKYISALGEEAPKYFPENTHSEGKGKERAGYAVTLEGCKYIEDQLAGSKGRVFHEWYMAKFDGAVADLTVQEVAEKLGVTERAVYKMIKRGSLKGFQKEIMVPMKKLYVSEESLNTYLEEKGVAQ